MSEFEYLAVFVSIIFGISITHLLAGAIRSVYDDQVNHTRVVLTVFIFMVLILNWWTLFFEHEKVSWDLTVFTTVIVWSVTHYVAAITLYPPRSAHSQESYAFRPRWFLWAFVGVAATDILQTTARGGLFTEWTYLPFVCHYIVVTAIAIALNRRVVYRVIAWYLLVVTVLWAFGMRNLLI